MFTPALRTFGPSMVACEGEGRSGRGWGVGRELGRNSNRKAQVISSYRRCWPLDEARSPIISVHLSQFLIGLVMSKWQSRNKITSFM